MARHNNAGPDKWAPSLKARLVGDASIYKPLLDRDMLKGPNDGVDHFKIELRPHFVKGVEAVFIFRFYQLQRFYRGSQDLQRWIGRLQVLRKRFIDAWMVTFHPDPPEKKHRISNKPCKWTMQDYRQMA